MSNARALSTDDIRGLRDELAAGGRPTVWFTSSAVGVQEGRSGKVVALDEPAEGEFVQVRPAGSKDVLSFSAGEVTVVKPARTPRKETASSKSADASKSTADSKSGAASSGAKATEAGSSGAKSATAQPAGTKSTSTESAGTTSAKTATTSAKTGTTSSRTASAGKAKPKNPAGATVTLTAGEDGQWHVEVSNGRKRVVKPTPVSASAVAGAAKELHEDVAQAVEPLLEAAREHQRARVEQLQRELSDAQRMLDELSG